MEYMIHGEEILGSILTKPLVSLFSEKEPSMVFACVNIFSWLMCVECVGVGSVVKSISVNRKYFIFRDKKKYHHHKKYSCHGELLGIKPLPCIVKHFRSTFCLLSPRMELLDENFVLYRKSDALMVALLVRICLYLIKLIHQEKCHASVSSVGNTILLSLSYLCNFSFVSN